MSEIQDPFEALVNPRAMSSVPRTTPVPVSAPMRQLPVAPVEEKTAMITMRCPAELAERLRNAAYWDRFQVSEFLRGLVRTELDRMEAERGEAYPPKPA